MYIALLIMTVVIYALVCFVYARHEACSWFHPLTIYLAFHGLVFVVRPILSWYYDYTFIYQLYLFLPDDYAKEMTLVVVNLGLLSFAFASLRWGNARLQFKADRATDAQLRELRRPLWWITPPLLAIIAYSLVQILTLRVSGFDAVDADRTTGTFVNTTGNGYAQFAYLMAASLLPMLAWSGRFRIWWLGAIGLSALLLAGSGIRGPIVSLLVCAATLYLYASRRRAPDLRVVAVTIAMALAFNAIGADRGEQARSLLGGADTGVTHGPARLAPLEGMDLGNLEFVEFLVDKVPRATRSYNYFLDNLQIITEPIPRALWRDKPVGQPIRLFYLTDYGYPIGMTNSLPGEGWVQLGLFGVALWCGLCGVICGVIYNRFALGQQTPIQIAFYAAFLSTLIVFYRDGALISLLRQGIFFLAPPALWWLAARFSGATGAADQRLLDSVRSRAARRARVETRGRAGDPEAAGDEGDDDGSALGASGNARDLSHLPRSRRHPRRAVSPRA